jgi:hypothetical protein
MYPSQSRPFNVETHRNGTTTTEAAAVKPATAEAGAHAPPAVEAVGPR